MPISKLSGIMAGVFSLCFCAAFPAPAQTPPPPAQGSVAPLELDQAKKTARTFSADWKSLKFDSMYALMSEGSQAGMPKEKFCATFGVKPENAGKVVSFSVKKAVPGDDGIIVDVVLAFVKENPPTEVNGVHGFHMIKENGKWKVKAIVPPIAPPEETGGSGGHPGE